MELLLNPDHVADYKRVMDDELLDFDQFCHDKYHRKLAVLPCVEVILSRHQIDPCDPGYQKPSIRVQTIFHGDGNLFIPKKQVAKNAKIIRKRNLNHEFLIPSEDSNSSLAD